MGGIPIFTGALFSLLLWMNTDLGIQNKFLLSSLIILFIIGIRDDLIPMRARYKLASQLAPILLVSIFSNIQLSSFYSLVDVDFNYIFTLLATTFTLIVITNSFNLIDGIDGLAGTLGTIILATLGLWFFHTGNMALSYIAFAFIGGLLAFLIYNWSPSRIFMGDTGALLVGLLIGCLVIHFININHSMSSLHNFKIQASISFAICILIIPLTDTLRVFFLRIIKLKSPLEADNNHIHHELIGLGLSHSTSTIILGLVNLAFIALAYFCRNISDRAVLLIVIVTVSLLLLLLMLIKTRRTKA